MMVGNKAVMLEFGDYPNFLTLLQNGATVVALFAMKSAGTIEMKPFSVLQWKVFAVNAVLLAIQILSSLLALPLVAIATVVAFRNLANIAVAGLEYLIFGKTLSVSSISGLALIVASPACSATLCALCAARASGPPGVWFCPRARCHMTLALARPLPGRHDALRGL